MSVSQLVSFRRRPFTTKTSSFLGKAEESVTNTTYSLQIQLPVDILTKFFNKTRAITQYDRAKCQFTSPLQSSATFINQAPVPKVKDVSPEQIRL